MKIGFFTDCYLPAALGTEISIETFRGSLEDLGQQVFICAPRIKKYKSPNPNILLFRSFETAKRPGMHGTYAAIPFFPINNFFKALCLKLDIVHCHTLWNMGFFGRYIAWRKKLPVIYTHHIHLTARTRSHFMKKFYKIFTTWYSNIFDAVIAPTYKIKKLLEDYGVKKPIYVLSTGIDLGRFKKPSQGKEELRKELDIASQSKVLIFVGSFSNEREKNPDFLLSMLKEILKERKDVVLLMVGGGPDLVRLKALAGELNLGENIKFTGFIPSHKIPVCYQASDIFVFSSLTETQGIVILEAMASGLPVVALEDLAFKEMVINNQNGFLIKESRLADFARKVTEILDNPSMHKEFSAASQKIAGNFSKEKQAQKLLRIYEDLIQKHSNKNV